MQVPFLPIRIKVPQPDNQPLGSLVVFHPWKNRWKIHPNGSSGSPSYSILGILRLGGGQPKAPTLFDLPKDQCWNDLLNCWTLFMTSSWQLSWSYSYQSHLIRTSNKNPYNTVPLLTVGTNPWDSRETFSQIVPPSSLRVPRISVRAMNQQVDWKSPVTSVGHWTTYRSKTEMFSPTEVEVRYFHIATRTMALLITWFTGPNNGPIVQWRIEL